MSALIVSILCLGAAGLGVWIFDRYLTATSSTKRLLEMSRPSIAALELYPYTGFHIQARYRHEGDLENESQPYHDYDIHSGDLGFFDFHLQPAYPKRPEEFRIVLIGGSGAQGWGARTNDDMYYRRIPKYLNEELKGCNIEATMINLAMASSVTYQNFVALNRLGHPLIPDMILSYSGRNDVIVPFTEGAAAFFSFAALNGLFLSSRPSESRGWVASLERWLPGIMQETTLGTGFRVLTNYRRLVSEGQLRYGEMTGASSRMGFKPFFEKVVKQEYLDALKSIKRDFNGVPMVVAWQAVTESEWQATGLLSASQLGPSFYRDWFKEVQDKLAHYVNDEWYFYDMDAYMRQFPEDNTGTHQGNAGQDRISRKLAGELAPVIAKLRRANCRS